MVFMLYQCCDIGNGLADHLCELVLQCIGCMIPDDQLVLEKVLLMKRIGVVITETWCDGVVLSRLYDAIEDKGKEGLLTTGGECHRVVSNNKGCDFLIVWIGNMVYLCRNNPRRLLIGIAACLVMRLRSNDTVI